MEMELYINALLFIYIFHFSACVRLNPLENNDKLQSINSEFIAEWQWESWPIKQNASEKEVAAPGPRVNAALWKDNNGVNWYLFGGRPIDPGSEKIYSDIWKYSVVSRVWERVFPFMTPQDGKGKFAGKLGGMVSLRVNFFDENSGKKPQKHEGNNIILCGRSAKRNVTKTKKNIWSNFSRRKVEPKTNSDESKSLAVYGPKTSKSNTVWQIDLKDKLWTGYVCCCDTSNYDKLNPSPKELKTDLELKRNVINQTDATERKNQTSIIDKIDKTEDEVDREQEHMTIEDSKSKKKKINQMKKIQTKYEDKKMLKLGDGGMVKKNQTKTIQVDNNNNGNESRKIEEIQKLSNETVFMPKNQSDIMTVFKNNGGGRNLTFGTENRTFIFDRDLFGDDLDFRSNFTENGKSPSKYCPDFTDEEEPVSWCDGNSDALITVDLSSSPIILWVFNLKTSHWSQQVVEIGEDTQWPACSNTSSIRYAGSGDEVYILCSAVEDPQDSTNLNASDATKNTTESDTKLIYRISSKRLLLESLGKIKLGNFFNQSDSGELWRNESKSSLHIIRLPSNETLLLLAYKDVVDLWTLIKTDQHGHRFEQVENVWRGSARKWFTQYNTANYNFQFISESNQRETVLILNPRSIPFSEYWPRERGRFIIRILRNENMRNHNINNQTREHNLTYDLLQSDINSPIAEGPFSHSYNLKVIIFFGISLAIFAAFGFVLFLKKCVNCPSRILTSNECHKSPPIIRYSVMRDDLLYPAA